MIRLIVLGAIAFAMLAGAAVAQQVNAPPGNSAIDEYLETVPAAGGDRPAAAGPRGGSGLPRAAQAQLARRGLDGERLARIVARTGPDRSRAADRGPAAERSPAGSSERSDGTRAAAPATSSPAAMLASAALGDDGGEGLGRWLAVLLGLSAIAALAMAARGRRS